MFLYTQELAILPTADVSRGAIYRFWDMLHALLQISTYEEELDSLLALPEHQNSSELVALQTVTKILIENSCDLVSLVSINFKIVSNIIAMSIILISMVIEYIM